MLLMMSLFLEILHCCYFRLFLDLVALLKIWLFFMKLDAKYKFNHYVSCFEIETDELNHLSLHNLSFVTNMKYVWKFPLVTTEWHTPVQYLFVMINYVFPLFIDVNGCLDILLFPLRVWFKGKAPRTWQPINTKYVHFTISHLIGHGYMILQH